MKDTSWESVGKWYDSAVGELGHYYHQHIVIPGALKLLELEKSKPVNVLDLACGQGILARHLPPNTSYAGLDGSKSLIQAAKKYDPQSNHSYHVADVTEPFPLKERNFTHATILLALQNIEHPDKVLQNACHHLVHQGRLIIVLNHPCYRIPRQSSWGIDEASKMQYRRVNRYMSDMKIPLQAHPSKGESSATTMSFHHPLSSYSRWLNNAGFVIDLLEEWISDKVSTGKAARMENRSREEFPLFLAIRAIKA